MRIAGRRNGIGIVAHSAAVAAAVAVALLAPVSGAGSQTLAALPAVTIPAAPVGEARPVPAWTEFCARYASECAVDPSEPAQVTLTPRLWQTVTGINRQVNTSLRAVTDMDHWGVPDRWDLAEDGSGDCEDFQLLKRKLLAQAGLPRRAMRMTVVIDEKGEGHAVLMLRTDRGDLVLDNKTSAVLPWHKTGYTYIKREGDEGARWVSLGRAVSPVVTANR
ncbi:MULTISPECIES: transglutaminase-like cysteine peptidase [Methylobacterium]|uniref:transglutaminase-like cysteine peptidase n=1 Tax=Methylobacterium TaxID=407 RepID=UPI0013EA420C|nr:transglutaminase-like cysteine peptidase [Methylobacterium sp. DB0501]NGM36234.1 transglutaminase-like cysteine peptidase [Methylobacterium sp. DB0501]